jgi:hypothetical protein
VANQEEALAFAKRHRIKYAEAVKVLADMQEAADFVLVEPSRPIESGDLPASALKVYRALVAMGWETLTHLSITHHDDVLWATDSEEGAETERSKGDVKTPAHDRRHYWLSGRHKTLGAAFTAHWEGKGRDGKNATFQSARVADPAGIPVENFVDYMPTKTEAKSSGNAEAAMEHGARQSQEYNDGTLRLENVVLMTTTRDFLAWIDDWLGLLAPKHKSLSSKPKERSTT